MNDQKKIEQTDLSPQIDDFSGEPGLGGEDLRERNRAILNILDDVAESERNLRRKTVELEKFQQAADESFDHVVITDAEGIILYANNAVSEITGYTNQEIIGHSSALWGGKMPKAFYQNMWRTIKEEKRRFAGEVSNVKKNGQRYLASIRISPILDRKGRVRFFVGVERDITEERASQLAIVEHAKELQKEKERAESILGFLKSIGDGVVAIDLDSKIIFFNEAAERMIGKKSDEVLGLDVAQVRKLYAEKDPDHPLQIMQQALETGKPINSGGDKYYLLKEDGSTLAISFSVSPIFDKNSQIQGAITVYRDITEQRELEKTKDNFLSVAAHQLRTPLSGIRWDLEMLLDGDAGELPAEAKETVKHIDENTQRLVVLVNDLLDVSRINMGNTKEEATPINICKMLGEAVQGLQGLIKERKVSVSLDSACKLDPSVKAAPKHLFQVFENLLSNAVKYTPEGGKIKVVADYKEDKVIVSISDNGIGIPQKDQDKLFTKFFRASNAVLKETEGSGLGLSVVKSFIEESGGKITFQSEEGKGTTFFVTLPAYVPAAK